MRKSTLIQIFSKRRLSLLGLAVVMTVLALFSRPQPAFAAGCLPYCTDWQYTATCCYSSTSVLGRYYRQCTDGAGNYCDQYMCSGACAV